MDISLSPMYQNTNPHQMMYEEEVTSPIRHREKVDISRSRKGFPFLKIQPADLPDECVDYLRNNIHPAGGDNAAFRSPLDPNIKVSLVDKELWQKFAEEGTEMVVTKPGRRLYPLFRVKVEGLDPNQLYCIIMDFANTDRNRYKYQNRKWMAAGVALPLPPSTYYVHPSSPSLGSKWMKEIVSFHKAKLTTSTKNLSYGKLLVHSMQRYQARLHVARADDVTTIDPVAISTFSFDLTSFITVTAYQNIEITKLKVAHNPFAKGFRAMGGKRQNSFDNAFWSTHDANYAIPCDHQESVCVWNSQRSYLHMPNSSREFANSTVKHEEGHPTAWLPSQMRYDESCSNQFQQVKQNNVRPQETEHSSNCTSSSGCLNSFEAVELETPRAIDPPPHYNHLSHISGVYELPSHRLMHHSMSWNCTCQFCSNRNNIESSSNQHFASRAYNLGHMQPQLSNGDQQLQQRCNARLRSTNMLEPNSYPNVYMANQYDTFTNGATARCYYYSHQN